MSVIDEARKKEFRDQLKLIPFAVVALILLCGLYAVGLSQEISVFGYTLWGVAKGLWFLLIILVGGFAGLSVILSISILFLIANAAKKINTTPHPWRPIVISSKYLLIGSFLLYITMNIELIIRENIESINNWYSYNVGDGNLHFVVASCWWMALIFISTTLMGLFVQFIMLPSQAQEMVDELPKKH